jgi:hypothetical protein
MQHLRMARVGRAPGTPREQQRQLLLPVLLVAGAALAPVRVLVTAVQQRQDTLCRGAHCRRAPRAAVTTAPTRVWTMSQILAAWLLRSAHSHSATLTRRVSTNNNICLSNRQLLQQQQVSPGLAAPRLAPRSAVAGAHRGQVPPRCLAPLRRPLAWPASHRRVAHRHPRPRRVRLFRRAALFPGAGVSPRAARAVSLSPGTHPHHDRWRHGARAPQLQLVQARMPGPAIALEVHRTRQRSVGNNTRALLHSSMCNRGRHQATRRRCPTCSPRMPTPTRRIRLRAPVPRGRACLRATWHTTATVSSRNSSHNSCNRLLLLPCGASGPLPRPPLLGPPLVLSPDLRLRRLPLQRLLLQAVTVPSPQPSLLLVLPLVLALAAALRTRHRVRPLALAGSHLAAVRRCWSYASLPTPMVGARLTAPQPAPQPRPMRPPSPLPRARTAWLAALIRQPRWPSARC